MISFIHKWDATAASYRYRALIPSREIGASINDYNADVLVYAKPLPSDVDEIKNLSGKRLIVDVCDDYTMKKWFHEILKCADAITCSTLELKKRLESFGYEATQINDPYEFDLCEPHCNGDHLLWFGHGSNLFSLNGRLIGDHPLRIVSNVAGTIQWSHERMLSEFAMADIVLIPETARFKSPNRTVESVRQGCFVVAERHPALNDIPGIWLGNLGEGIEWAVNNLEEANQWTRQAQEYLSKLHNPQACGNAWKKICEEVSDSILVAEENTGTDG